MPSVDRLREFGYFYDALSGILLAPCDPIRARIHTLGRILTLTLAEGEASARHTAHELRTRKLSWAPVHSIVEVSNDEFVRSLTLTDGESKFSVVHTFNSGEPRGIQVFTPEDATSPAFESSLPGDDLGDIQISVRKMAQAFFDKFPAAQ